MGIEIIKDQRTIYLYDEFNGNASFQITKAFQEFALQDFRQKEDVHIVLNSPGGYVKDFFAIYDMMRKMQFKTNVTAIGHACSCGFNLLVGATGKRKAFPNTEIMMHELSHGIWLNKISQNRSTIEHTEEVHKRLRKIIADHTKWTEKEVEELWQKDFWMWPEQALEHGVIDEIVTFEKEKGEPNDNI